MATVNWPIVVGVLGVVAAGAIIYMVLVKKGYLPKTVHEHEQHHPGINVGFDFDAEDEKYPPLPIPIE